MANVINEIKNWCLFTEKFGEEYQMHDAVIKRFDLNKDELTIVVNTLRITGTVPLIIFQQKLW